MIGVWKWYDDGTERESSENECCPLGGDETNDCEWCVYSGEYHFVNGECVKREIKN
jgi:hypothetical protein